MTWSSFPDSNVPWKRRARPSLSPSYCTTFTSLAAPSAYLSPTKPVYQLISHWSNHREILARIALVRHNPGAFVRMTCANMRGRLEFHFRS